MANWFQSGEALEHVSIEERALHYGDGLFETIAIRRGEPRLWQQHMDRLSRGCSQLGIHLPPRDELRAGVLAAIEASNVASAYATAKIIVSPGPGARGYGRGVVEAPSVWYGAFTARPVPVSGYRDGVDTCLCDTRLATNTALAGLKTLNRLEQVLARSESRRMDVFEGLTMDADDNVICGTMSNVFFVKNNSIATSPMNRCGVEGVMRRHVIDTLRGHDIVTDLEDRHTSDFGSIDEAFLTNSQFGVLPIRRCDQYRWSVGEVTKSVMAMLAKAGVVENLQ